MAHCHLVIGRIRFIMMTLTGVMCLIYAIMVLITKQPAPISPWWLAALGSLTATIIFISFQLAGRDSAEMAMDERYYALDGRANRIGYLSALFMYPIFGIAMAHDYIGFQLAFPIMASLTGAAYLIPQVIMTGWDR